MHNVIIVRDDEKYVVRREMPYTFREDPFLRASTTFYLSLFPLATNKHCVAPFIRILTSLLPNSRSDLSKRATRAFRVAEISIVRKTRFQYNTNNGNPKERIQKMKRYLEQSGCLCVFCMLYGKVRREETCTETSQ